jgi:hypothetical protein
LKLIEGGANPNLAENDGWVPLLFAVYQVTLYAYQKIDFLSSCNYCNL